ncbi:MAG TPA: hypothetical protein VLK33_09010 [Terriglobales bacterium]|nr:hypothetical protein [Terriglobales bacterium]
MQRLHRLYRQPEGWEIADHSRQMNLIRKLGLGRHFHVQINGAGEECIVRLNKLNGFQVHFTKYEMIIEPESQGHRFILICKEGIHHYGYIIGHFSEVSDTRVTDMTFDVYPSIDIIGVTAFMIGGSLFMLAFLFILMRLTLFPPIFQLGAILFFGCPGFLYFGAMLSERSKLLKLFDTEFLESSSPALNSTAQ